MPPHIPANHRSQATNRVSCHASHRYQQMKDNKLYNLPCFTRIPAKRKQQIVHLAMPHTDISQAEETKRKSYHASHRYQQITGNKSYILPCLTHRPANHKQQIVLASQIHQQISTTNQAPVNHGQHIVHVALPHTCTSKSPTTNRSSYHASYRKEGRKESTSGIRPRPPALFPAEHLRGSPQASSTPSARGSRGGSMGTRKKKQGNKKPELVQVGGLGRDLGRKKGWAMRRKPVIRGHSHRTGARLRGRRMCYGVAAERVGSGKPQTGQQDSAAEHAVTNPTNYRR